jgi:hypothetical protein
MMILKKHIPSHITVAGHRALILHDGQPQTCYGCGDTEHMYHVCPKRRGAKNMTPAPVDHTWANIVASATIPIDVPGTSDTVNMDTDPRSLVVGEIMFSAASEGQGQPVPASPEDLKHTCDAPPSQTIATSEQVCSTLTLLKWADEDPDFEQTSSTGARPSDDVPAAAKEWPPPSPTRRRPA